MPKETTKVLCEREIVEGTGDWLVTSIFYQKGGLSYYTYKEEPRGYYLSARIVHRERVEGRDGSPGYTMESFVMFSNGMKQFIEPAKMFSAKKLASLEVATPIVAELEAKVLETCTSPGAGLSSRVAS